MDDCEVARMSLAGQWISDYAGTTKGTLVLDVDDLGDRYHGVACAWDANPNLPSSLVRFVADPILPNQTLRQVKVLPIVAGRILTPEDIQGWAQRGDFE